MVEEGPAVVSETTMLFYSLCIVYAYLDLLVMDGVS